MRAVHARCASYVPNTSRSSLQISPTVQRARSASRIGGSRFSSVPATRRTSASGFRGLVRVPLGAHLRRPLELAPLGLGVEVVQLDRLRLLLAEPVHPDDHLLARLDLGRVLVRRVLDLPLDEALLDRLDRAAELVHALDQLAGAPPRARPSAPR